MAAEWDRFKFEVGMGYSEELTTVRHVAHVPSACRIVEDGRIKAGLVYDESRLNKSRIRIAWVSANTWQLGSIYGTVEFQFSWTELIANQKIYWVEAMNYRPNAYRFLLSNSQIPGGLISPYDPTKDEGPLRLRDGKYYWNGEYTSEFMIEDDLLLDRCTGIDFVQHHPIYCRLFGQDCKDRQDQIRPERTGAKILSFLLSKGLHVLDKYLKSPTNRVKLDSAYVNLAGSLQEGVSFAGTINRDIDCQNVVHGSLALYSMDQPGQARRQLALISSKEKFMEALKAVVQAHFSDPQWEPIYF